MQNNILISLILPNRIFLENLATRSEDCSEKFHQDIKNYEETLLGSMELEYVNSLLLEFKAEYET